MLDDVRIYTSDMELIGFVSGITSLQWHRMYYAPGEFELHVAITDDNVRYMQLENLIWIPGKPEAGAIESVDIKYSATERDLVVKGRFLESYMDRRLIRPSYTADNANTETVMRTLLTNAVPIPHVVLGDAVGITDTVSFNAQYKGLLDYEQRLAKSAAVGFRFRPDFEKKTITFEIWQGVDRSAGQSDRPQVIFSTDYGNLEQIEYSKDTYSYKTVCYVGQFNDGVATDVYTTGDDTLTGLDRRETWLEASDVDKNSLTSYQYQSSMIQRGKDELRSNKCKSSTFDSSVNPDGNFKYLMDYDLGDIVTIRRPEWGIERDERITEINEVYENGIFKIEPTFGTKARIAFKAD